MSGLTFDKAVKNLRSNTGEKIDNIQVIYDEVAPLCKTISDTSEENSDLWDYLYDEVDFTARNIDPVSLAAEWDDLFENS